VEKTHPLGVPPSKGRSTTGFNTLTSCRPTWHHQPKLKLQKQQLVVIEEIKLVLLYQLI
jgi:hypothetical protein